jgi:hypothetical protein
LTSSKASIRERQLNAVEIFEHQNNRQIKSNASVREPSLAEQRWMLTIVGQERWGGVVAIVNGNFWTNASGFVHLRRN